MEKRYEIVVVGDETDENGLLSINDGRVENHKSELTLDDWITGSMKFFEKNKYSF